MVINIFGSRSNNTPEKKESAGQTVEGTLSPVAPVIPKKQAHIIVIGNEKGGSGKTTTTMHLIVALLRLGFTVGSIDLDARQRTLSRYIENRRQTITKTGTTLPLPHHAVVKKSPFNLLDEAEADESERFTQAITKLATNNDFVVIDSPGNDTFLSRFAHSFADTVVTPINDSFVDLDVLATVDGSTLKVVRPSIYSEMVWEQKLLRAKRDGGSIEWIVMRNRLSNIDARNKRFMSQVLTELSRRIGFRVAPGFSERVIFREMFLQGLTVLDVLDTSTNISVSMSHVAARQEVRELLKVLRIPTIDERIARQRTKPGGEDQEIADSRDTAVSAADRTAPAEVKAPAAVAAPPKPVTAPASPQPATTAAAATVSTPTPAPAPVATTAAPAFASTSVTATASATGTTGTTGTPVQATPATVPKAVGTPAMSQPATTATTPAATPVATAASSPATTGSPQSAAGNSAAAAPKPQPAASPSATEMQQKERKLEAV